MLTHKFAVKDRSLLIGRAIAFTLSILCIMTVLWYITVFAVNVPFSDDWRLTRLFYAIYRSSFSFANLWEQVNEHRLIFPRLIIMGLAYVSDYNVKVQMYFSVLLVVATLLVLNRLTYLTHSPTQHRLFLYGFNAIALFSWVQYENWLWGFQLAWFLIHLCLAIAILLVVRSQARPHTHYLAAIPCLIASFSSAHGLFTWLAMLPVVASLPGGRSQRLHRLGLWVLFLLGTGALYSIGYQRSKLTTDPMTVLTQPLRLLHYLLNLLGSPLTSHPPTVLTLVLGMLILLGGGAVVFHFLRLAGRTLQPSPQAAPWLSLGMFALLFALVTSVGRMGHGVEQANAGRYTTVLLLLIIAIVQLCALLPWKRRFLLVWGVVTLLLIHTSWLMVDYGGHWRRMRLVEMDCTEMVHVLPMPGMCPRPLGFRIKLENLLRVEVVGFRTFPPEVPFVANAGEDYGSFAVSVAPPEAIAIDDPELPPVPSWLVAGWAATPEQERMPRLVVLTDEWLQPIDTAAVFYPSPDLAVRLGAQKYSEARWQATIPMDRVANPTQIRAWVYEAQGQRLLQLSSPVAVGLSESLQEESQVDAD